MARNIKFCLIIIFFALILTAIIKDKVFDTAENCIKKIPSKVISGIMGGDIFTMKGRLVYKMYFWSLIPMGELEFTIDPQAATTVFSFEAFTRDSFAERFVAAQARVDSYISRTDFLPAIYKEKTMVNGKIKEKIITYNRIDLRATVGDKKVKIFHDTYDPLGAFIHMLNLPFDKIKTYAIPFISGYDIYILKATLLDRKNGVDALGVEMRRQNLTSSHGANLRVWTNTNGVRLPLVFKIWTPVGYASVVLEQVKI